MLIRVRAIIIKDNKVLTIKRSKQDLIYFVFPGGKVEQGEDLETALKRESKEELGVEIEIIEKFGSKRFDKGDIKQLEYFYICNIVSGKLGTGEGPEYNLNSDYEGTHEIKWLAVKDLLSYNLRPKGYAIKLFIFLKMSKLVKNKIKALLWIIGPFFLVFFIFYIYSELQFYFYSKEGGLSISNFSIMELVTLFLDFFIIFFIPYIVFKFIKSLNKKRGN